MLIGPEQRAVQPIDEAVAVRPDDRHVAGGLDQGLLQFVAVCKLRHCLAKARSIADGAAGAAFGKLAHDLDRQHSVYADESGVRRTRKLSDRAVATPASDLVQFRMHRPDVAGETHQVALLDHPAGFLAAEDGNGARPDETVE